MPRTGAVLGWRKEVVRGEVVKELALSRSLYDFGNDGNDGYGAVV